MSPFGSAIRARFSATVRSGNACRPPIFRNAFCFVSLPKYRLRGFHRSWAWPNGGPPSSIWFAQSREDAFGSGNTERARTTTTVVNGRFTVKLACQGLPHPASGLKDRAECAGDPPRPPSWPVTCPSRRVRRSTATDRTSSVLMKLFILRPASGGSTGTWRGIPLAREVTGSTTANPAGPWLKVSTETTSAGRTPACSWPRVGFRSTIQISPREGCRVVIRRPIRQTE